MNLVPLGVPFVSFVCLLAIYRSFVVQESRSGSEHDRVGHFLGLGLAEQSFHERETELHRSACSA